MSDLQKMIDQIENLDSEKYNDETWSAMLPTLEKAKAALENEKELYTNLITAFLNLRLKPNKDALNNLLKK